jgi:CPA2 family monovalent cation:H+ antiporter-2
LQKWLASQSSFARMLQRRKDPLAALPIAKDEKYLSGHVVLIGYGCVGSRIGEMLFKHGIPYVVVEQNRQVVESLRLNNIASVFGNASDPKVLLQTHIREASMLVIAIPNSYNIRDMIKTTRSVNPKISILVRVRDEEQISLLLKDKIEKLFFSEYELANNMCDHILSRYGIVNV